MGVGGGFWGGQEAGEGCCSVISYKFKHLALAFHFHFSHNTPRDVQLSQTKDDRRKKHGKFFGLDSKNV